MTHKMNSDKKILLIPMVLVMVALLATLWAISGPFGAPLERQGWERWNLNEARRRELEHLIEVLEGNGTSMQVIQRAVEVKFIEWGIGPARPGDIELFYTLKTVVSTVNVTLVLILLITYIDIYQRIKSTFTVGLIIFSLILLLYTLTSNPIMQWFFGFSAFGLGPFAMLPDLCACVALSILLYLSIKY